MMNRNQAEELLSDYFMRVITIGKYEGVCNDCPVKDERYRRGYDEAKQNEVLLFEQIIQVMTGGNDDETQ